MPLSYDLTTFQILGQKFVKFFVGILVQTMTPKGHFEINRPLKDMVLDVDPDFCNVVTCKFEFFKEPGT